MNEYYIEHNGVSIVFVAIVVRKMEEAKTPTNLWLL